MVDWYRHDIPAWMNGCGKLSDKAYRAYHMIIQFIYLNEGSIELHERGLAGACNMHVLAFRAALRELLDAGKLSLTDGNLTNTRAESELNLVRTNRVHAGVGGRSPRDSRNKHLKTNGRGEATLHDFGAYKRREEKKESQ